MFIGVRGDVLYMLRPVRETEPGWWKLRWRPIWRYTYSLYVDRWRASAKGLGLRWYRTDANNGWNRSYKHFTLELLTPFLTVHFWVKWRFVVHRDGPSDRSVRVPLTLPEGKSS